MESLASIREQSVSIRRQIGEALRDLQKGMNLGMPLSRPMTTIAPGVHEIRVKGEGSTVRIFYYVRRSDAIIVFHAFQKKSQKTPLREINLAHKRLKEVLIELLSSSIPGNNSIQKLFTPDGYAFSPDRFTIQMLVFNSFINALSMKLSQRLSVFHSIDFR
ncbi:MAG: type II toxin-antitoxin system RelE/ParE family toxin, partial [Acidobacteria bacterium]|nr:type II toxin-antitoxin system RelE/ParE family toxin [Acidobacteriota bacterium]